MFADGECAVVPDEEELEEGVSDSVREEPEEAAKDNCDESNVEFEHLVILLVLEPANGGHRSEHWSSHPYEGMLMA